jgi:NADP-dependent 3-hydroxy acid dehydrogenase YdfG
MKIVNVNVVGTLNVTSTIFPLMAARKKGHVVNISSAMVSNVVFNKYELENKPHLDRVLVV